MPAQLEKADLPRKIDQFLDYLRIEKGSSPLTLRNYRHYLMRFYNWMENTTSEEINSRLITDYRLFLSKFENVKGNSLKKRTQSYHIIAMRSFLKWLIKNDYEVLAPEKIDLPKVEDRQVKYLNGEQVDRLLNAPSLSSIQGKRDKAILEVLFSTGLRVSELTHLDRDKIDLERREFGVLGKGGRARVVFLSNRAADWVKVYIKAREDLYKPLFIRHKGKTDAAISDEKMRLTPRSIQRLVKKYVRKVKLPVEATPHTMRHSFATDLLIAGADMRSVQEMLGHKNISTTQIYTHVTNKQMKDVHEAFHGKGN
jgi:site-specific recombinase XerD